ncbi:MAG: hypothetical protein ACMUEL_02715 [Flavobacteriales bacterium Tduv]
MLRSSARISFSELNMKRSSRKSEFFKRLKTLIHWEVGGKEIRKTDQKGQGIKSNLLTVEYRYLK